MLCCPSQVILNLFYNLKKIKIKTFGRQQLLIRQTVVLKHTQNIYYRPIRTWNTKINIITLFLSKSWWSYLSGHSFVKTSRKPTIINIPTTYCICNFLYHFPDLKILIYHALLVNVAERLICLMTLQCKWLILFAYFIFPQ